MGIPRNLRAAALVAAAVLLGLLTLQGSYALWSAAASAAPGAVTSASFDFTLAGPSTPSTNMTLAAGQPAIVSVNPSGALTPGNAVYSSVSVSNNSDAGGQFNISVNTGAAAKSNVAPGDLKGQSVTITIPLTATQLCGVPSGCA
jgi:hypothetical protein